MEGYLVALVPGALLLLAVALIPARAIGVRIGVLIFGFVWMRDLMTPYGLWTFGVTEASLPFLRFTEDVTALLALAAASAVGVVALLIALPDLRRLIVWFEGGRMSGTVLGLFGAVAVAGPVLWLGRDVPLADRGGEVATEVLPTLLVFALVGNLLEEILFRGVLHGHLEKHTGRWRAASATAVLFAACHLPLATTVTGLGWPILAFTFWEGVVCSLVRLRAGTAPAALTHGGAIFLLSAGLF